MEQELKDKLAALPGTPGVYEMLDDKGKIIYVGKAINLKNRVSSYFKGNKDTKTTALVEKIRDINWTLTGNEMEALILEANLIREKKPRYNIILRDDKHYPYLKINLDLPFPRLQVVRRKINDGALYFGPYVTVGSMRMVMNIIESIFPLRTCSDNELNHRSRPCLQYQIRRCMAPCMKFITNEDYGKLIQEVALLLSGKEKELLKTLKKKMQLHAEGLEFEQAAKVRDQLEVIEKLTTTQIIDKGHADERDIIGLHLGEKQAAILVLFVREGNLSSKEHYFIDYQQGEEKEAILLAFLEQYYANHNPGLELILPMDLGVEAESIGAYLTYRKGRKVYFSYPLKGEKKRLLEMAEANAAEIYRQKTETDAYKEVQLAKGLHSLKDYLNLSRLPKRIECYDISNINGTNTVASMVVFTEGRPDKKEYKKFKIRTVEGPNDFASMEEVLSRRFAMAEVAKPDLVLIDGGKGQLSSALKIIRGYGFQDLEVFGLAKKEELLFRENSPEPIFIPRNDKALLLLKEIRDEAHRFAITYHRMLRGKEMTSSIFDEMEGIGPKRKKELLKAFGSIKGIRNASLNDIMRVIKNAKAAHQVKDVIGNE